MYAKIALGNVRKSFRDFSVFFLTLAFGVCVFYAFGSINEQSAVISLNEDQRKIVEALIQILDVVSVLVVLVLGFLVVYANRFLIRRRKREFGIYLTLGMSTRGVSAIVVVETLAVGVVALAAGLALGVALSQLMMYLTARMFDATIPGFAFVFSGAACLKTVAYFAGVFLVSLVFNVFEVSRYKLIDLINAGRVSQKVRLRSLPLSVVLFVAACALIGVAYRTLLTYGMINEDMSHFRNATLLVSAGTLLLFFSVSGFLLRVVQTSKHVYLRGLNMFVFRQLNSRINTAWLSISLVCAMLFVAICGVCTGFSVAGGFNEAVRAGTPYDAVVMSYPTGMGFPERNVKAAEHGYDMIGALREEIPGYDSLVSGAVQVDQRENYDSESPELSYSGLMDKIDFTSSSQVLSQNLQSMTASFGNAVPIVAVSQVNALRAQLGEKPLELAADQCLAWTDVDMMRGFWHEVADQLPSLDIWGHSLAFASDQAVQTPLGNGLSSGTVVGALIVPDEVIPADARYTVSSVFLRYAGSRDEVEPKFQDAVQQTYGETMRLQDDGTFPWPVWSVTTAVEVASNAQATTVAVSYLAIYIGCILLVSCASVLALQQLSEAADNLGRYRVLAELGAEPGQISRALFAQIAVYFVFPLVVAVAHAGVALYVVNDLVHALTGYEVGSALVGTVAFVVALYGGYFVVTYLTSRGLLLRNGVRS